MNDFYKNLLGEFPKNPIFERTEVFHSDKVVFFKAQATLSQDACLKNSFSFIVMGQESFSAKIEGKTQLNEKNKVIAINPGQIHSASEAKVISEYIPIFIEQGFLLDLTYQMFGKDKVELPNKNFCINANTTELIMQFMEESSFLQPGSDLILQCLNIQLAINLLRCIEKPILEDFPLHNKKVVKLAESYLRENTSNKISLNDIAQYTNYSPYHFIRIFRNETGKTPFEYLQDLKIDKAERLLRDKKLSIIEVCYSSGFNNPSYFSNVFKKKKGVSPSAYRQSF